MQYKIEEILPVIKRITEKYTGKSSTSITYEKAEQLMGAVIYCIREYENNDGEKSERKEVYNKKSDAAEAYEAGYKKVMEKTYRAKEYYEDILAVFDSYENECCYDTVIKGMPEFFLHYDAKFQPQNHILTLDYPLIGMKEDVCGIDFIYDYMKALRTEQRFLSLLPRSKVIAILENDQADYRRQFINMGGSVIRGLSWIGLFDDYGKERGNISQIRIWIENMAAEELKTKLECSFKKLIQIIPENKLKDEKFKEDLLEYGKPAIHDFAVELKNIPSIINKYYNYIMEQ